MLEYWWSPRLAFIKGAALLILMAVVQLNQPFLSSFNMSSGELKKHEMIRFGGIDDERILYLWLNDTLAEPYKTEFRQPQRYINRNLSFIQKWGLTVWYDDKREIMQLKSNKTLIIDYDWFWWPSLLFYIVPAWLHFGFFFVCQEIFCEYKFLYRYVEIYLGRERPNIKV